MKDKRKGVSRTDIRTTISLSKELDDFATTEAKRLFNKNFSAYIASLVIQEYGRQAAAAPANQAAPKVRKASNG